MYMIPMIPATIQDLKNHSMIDEAEKYWSMFNKYHILHILTEFRIDVFFAHPDSTKNVPDKIIGRFLWAGMIWCFVKLS